MHLIVVVSLHAYYSKSVEELPSRAYANYLIVEIAELGK